MTVYILYQHRNGQHHVIDVYATRQAAFKEKKILRKDEPDPRITFPIIAHKVQE